MVGITDADIFGHRLILTKSGNYDLAPDGTLSIAMPIIQPDPNSPLFPNGMFSFANSSGQRAMAVGRGIFRRSLNGDEVKIGTMAGPIGWLSAPDQSGGVFVASGKVLWHLDTAGKATKVIDIPFNGFGNADIVFAETGATGSAIVLAQKQILFLSPEGSSTQLPTGLQSGELFASVGPEKNGQRFITTQQGRAYLLSRSGAVQPLDIGKDLLMRITGVSDPDKSGARIVLAASQIFKLGVDGHLERLPIELDRSAVYLVATGIENDSFVILKNQLNGPTIIQRLTRDRQLVTLATVPIGRDVNPVRQITEPAADGTRYIGTSQGLFQLSITPNITATATPPGSFSPGTELSISFKVEGGCIAFAKGDDFFLGDETGKAVDQETAVFDANSGALVTTLPAIAFPSGMRIYLYTKDGEGKAARISKPVEIKVERKFEDILKLIGVLLVALHTIIFLALTIAARWSRNAATLLLDPSARVVGIWWGLGLTYSSTLQRWLLRRWFDRRRADQKEIPYLPFAVTNRDTKEVISADQLASRIKPRARIWLQGSPGMGKTTLVRHIEASFFRGHANLPAAYKEQGYIPLLVRLRDVSIKGTGLGEGDTLWAARLAERTLGRQDFVLDDAGGSQRNLQFISSIIDRSNFVLFLDGSNEVAWSDQIGPAATARERPGLFVTSQNAPPPGGHFEHWRLPNTIDDAVGPLLRLLGGKDVADKLLERLKGSPLLAEIRSGYDVRLLLHFVDIPTKNLPINRPQLYRAMALMAVDGNAQEASFVSERAWEVWLSGYRQFATDSIHISTLNLLLRSDARIVREADGKLEFIHDQIEAFLAAWHASQTGNPFGTLAGAEELWRQRISTEQADFWGFVRDLSDDALVAKLYRWSLDKPDDRIEIQKAFRLRAQAI